MERSMGKILGCIDLNNLSLEEREFLCNSDFSETNEKPKDFSEIKHKNENVFIN